MPYKDKNKRNEAVKRCKEKNREKYLERRRELYKLQNVDKISNRKVLTDEERKNYKKNKNKKYREKYSDKIREKKKYYYQKNKSEINKKYLDKLRNNPKMKIAHNIRTRIYQALKGKNKVNSSVKSLGCTIEEFINFIENKFSGEMSWENHGSYWHLDHIKPLYLFNLVDKQQFLIACHYSNYQPLKKLDNLVKNKFYNE